MQTVRQALSQQSQDYVEDKNTTLLRRVTCFMNNMIMKNWMFGRTIEAEPGKPNHHLYPEQSIIQ